VLEYRKLEQKDIEQIILLAKDCREFYLNREDKILENWNNIEAIGGFENNNLMALLINDPYNIRPASSMEKDIYIKNVLFLKPLIHADFISSEETVIQELLNTYFDNLTYCDELHIYINVGVSDSRKKQLFSKLGFNVDSKFPKKMVMRLKREELVGKKLVKVSQKIKNLLTDMGLPFNEIDDNLIYTELLNVIIYILIDGQPDYVTVKFFAYLVALPEITQELVRDLLELNFHTTYGSFGIDRECNLLIINSKLAKSVNLKDMELTLKSIAMTVLRYNDLIIYKYKGESLFDCVLQERPEFPNNYRYLLDLIR